MALHDNTLKVGVMLQGIAQLAGTRVLQHERTVLVVQVGQGEGTLRQQVKKSLFRVAVVGHGLVVIQVVVGQIGEDATGEMQPCNTVLRHTVRAHLHEGIFAARIDHLLQQGVQLNRVGRSVCRRDDFTVDDVLNRREQPAVVARFGEEPVQQSGDGGLAVGAGHAHQFQLLRGISEEIGSPDAQHISRVVDLHVGDVFSFLARQFLAHNHSSTFFDGALDVVVAVDLRTFDGKKQGSFIDLTGIESDVDHVNIFLANDFQKVAIRQYVFDFHYFSSFRCIVLLALMVSPAWSDCSLTTP